MKKKAQKKLLKVISETADNMIKGKTCWWGKEAVETALLDMLTDKLTIAATEYFDNADFGDVAEIHLEDLNDYLPEPTRPGEGK